MLEKVVVIDKIEVLEDGQMQIRRATKIMEDGKELSRSYHRWTLSPGQNIDEEDVKVKGIANAAWTKDVVRAYKAEKLKRLEED